MKSRSKAITIALVVAVAAWGGWSILRSHLNSSSSVKYVTRPVVYADVAASVSETGTVNPVNTVDIGCQVSGTIKTLSVDYNSVVKKGQVLATLDPTTFQAAVDSAQANLRLAQANLDSAKVGVGKNKALLDLADLTVKQDEPLARQGLINQQQIDTERTAAITAEQDYLAAQSAVKVADAQVEVAQGQLDQARYSLSNTIIVSPFAGIIMARNISIGQTVASSLQTPTLFSLATNLTDMQVDTSVDEADVGSVAAGESAQIIVTAYPNQPFKGSVSQVRINPTTVQNVVTYDAVVAVHDSSGKLLPGMTAQVNIEVGKRSHVLTVPIAAVLYRPLAVQNRAQGSAFGGGFGAGVVQSSGAAPGGGAVAGAPGSQVTLWVLRADHPMPVQVVIGLSDGKNIEITSGNLIEGEQVIVAQYRGSSRGSTSRATQSGGGTGAAPSRSGGGGSSNGAPRSGQAPAGGTASSTPADTGAAPTASAEASSQPGAASGGPPASPAEKKRTWKKPAGGMTPGSDSGGASQSSGAADGTSTGRSP
ncbi:MAG: efflux RND transporter periplasmic adaptor subunit [Treponema sp.]|nr:efflux RND transporter periplasmic adaptor subunit [Treponema sp.]